MGHMEMFVEQIVPRRKALKDYAVMGAALFACTAVLLVSVLVMPYIMPYVIIVWAVAVFAAYWLMSGRSVEYEYKIVSGDFDVERIIAKRKRKKHISCPIVSFEHVRRLAEGEVGRMASKGVKVADVSSGGNYGEAYCTVASSDRGKVFLVFEPNERVLKALKELLPRKFG